MKTAEELFDYASIGMGIYTVTGKKINNVANHFADAKKMLAPEDKI